MPDPAKGLYETLLVVEERPVGLGRHLERLRKSAAAQFRSELPADLTDGAVAACRGIALGRLRLDIVFGDGDGEPTWTAKATAIDPDEFFPPWERGASLRTVEAPEWSGAHKWADRGWLEEQEAALDPAVPILLGAGGVVLEAARANVFAVLDGTLVTPPLDGRILPGTGRDAVLTLAADLDIPAGAMLLRPADLLRSGEVFLTSSVRGIRPARSLDGTPLPGHSTTDRLSEALRERWLAAD
jgi:para-aminobenzoate synthetase / 4-amino-4-deoxychorismate lyase